MHRRRTIGAGARDVAFHHALSYRRAVAQRDEVDLEAAVDESELAPLHDRERDLAIAEPVVPDFEKMRNVFEMANVRLRLERLRERRARRFERRCEPFVDHVFRLLARFETAPEAVRRHMRARI